MTSGAYLDVYEDLYLGDPVFPVVPLGVEAEILIGDTWTDITDYVAHSGQDGQGHPEAIAIQRGRPDEQTTTPQPALAAFQLNNIDGRFTSRNPNGPYYGSLGRNTPNRVSIPYGEVYLRSEEDDTSYISCPDSAGVSITGDIDIQVEFELSDYGRGYLADKWDSVTPSQSWIIQLNLNGTVTFFWSTTGSNSNSATSTIAIPLGHQALRVTLDVDNGASGNTTTFYTSDTISGSWTQLGSTVVQAGTTSIFDSTAVVKLFNGCNGSLFAFKLLSGIGGTTEASPTFSAATAGAGTYTDGQGNVWTPHGAAEFSDRDYRFHGEMASLPVTWDPTGQDVWVPVSAAGILRRLQQGQQPPVLSAMRRAIQYKTGSNAPVAYWPAEDGTNSTSLASAIGGPPIRFANAIPELSSDSAFACSSALPVMNTSSWNGSVPAYTGTGVVVLRFLMDIPSGTSTPDGTIVARILLTSGTIEQLVLKWGTAGTLRLIGYDYDGGNVIDTTATSFGLTGGQQVWVSMELQVTGGNATGTVTTLQPGAGSAFSASDFVPGGSIGRAISVRMNPDAAAVDFGVGHISVQSAWESLFDDANPLQAWTGEMAGSRFYRLCSENGITGHVYGHPSLSVAMGPQLPDAFLNLIQQCEDADRGQIFEPRQYLGIAYRTLASMTNQSSQLSLDYAADHLVPPLLPTDDDQFTVNDVTVSNIDGSSARATLDDGSPMSISPPPVGVGEYANSYSANLESDNQLADVATWILHVGTANDQRYPSIAIDLASTQDSISDIKDSVQAIDIGDFVDIVDMPDFMPPDPVQVLVWGIQETLGDFCFSVAYNCVPESPYEIAVVNNASTGLGKVDTAGSSLHSSATSGATSISVDTTDTSLWTTNAGDCPIDIMIGGEQMTVTAISGSSSPQTFTVTRSVNGVVKAHSAADVVELYRPSIVALTG